MAGKRYCPNCGSENVYEENSKYICNSCDFEADVFPEKHILVEDIADEEDEDEIFARKARAVEKIKKTKKGRKK